ncbi:MAG: hypothetical protein ACRDTT_28130 [Pseudonocardiaceae bacterium]
MWVHKVDIVEIDETVTGTAHMFQTLVDKAADLRVTVVGNQVFGVRIDADPRLIDWRYDYDRLSYATVATPPSLAVACQIFLECNANGQWAWLQEHTGLPMVAAFADLLEGGMS